MPNRPRLTYANVASTIALVLALGGGVAYAAGTVRSGDLAPGAVHTSDVYKRAITSGKLARGAVHTNQIADASVGAKQIGLGAVAPDNLQFPVYAAASPSGGSAPVTNGPDPYPLSGANWTQSPGQIQVVFGAGVATLAYDGSGSGSCQVYFEVSLNGQQVGGGELRTESTTPVRVEQSIGAQPQVDPLAPTAMQLSIRTGSNGSCTQGSRIESTRFRVIDFG